MSIPEPTLPSAAMVALAAFLVGSIPFGYLIGRAKGIDVRAHGSGNIGATNLGRILGRRFFALCFTLDLLKGLLPVALAGVWLGTLGAWSMPPADAWTWLAIMAAPVLGHVFCPWLGFRGGKGVATGLGVILGVFPVLTIPALASAATWGVVAWRSRYISLASIVAAALLPIWTVATAFLRAGEPRAILEGVIPFFAVAGLLAGVVIAAHRGNIARLRAGTERRIGSREGR